MSGKTNGAVRTCGLAPVKSGRQPNLGRENLREAWNSDYFRSIRQTMLSGQFPQNCSKCFYREKLNGESRRQIENRSWQNVMTEEKAKQLTADDGSLQTPPICLDIRTGNICNLKCVTCFPTNSIKWLEDKPLLGKYENTKAYDVTPAWDDPEGPVWQFVRENAKALHKLCFLGGEPLASRLHQSVLDTLVEQEAFQVRLKYVTNGTLLKPELIEKWQKFKHVEILVSLDGINSILEFIRFPAKWQDLLRKLQLLNSTESSNFSRQILWTCSNLSLFYLPETISFSKEYLPNLNFSLGDWVVRPSHLSPQNLPKAAKQAIHQRIQNCAHLANDSQVKFFLNHMDQQDLWPEHGQVLLNYLDDLDKVRGTNWKMTFEDLSQFVSEDQPLARQPQV